MSAVYHYNPDLLTDDGLRAQFVVRNSLLRTFVTALRSAQPGHHLVLGQRGMGKTTFLRRIHLAIRDDAKLRGRWMPLSFPEEQYNVGSLADFWANCVDALADSLERTGKATEAAQLDARIDRLDRSAPAAALEILLDTARSLSRGLVLLVDNLDIVLSRLTEREQWEFRQVLGGDFPIILIGGSAHLQGEASQYGKSFYEFLHVHPLPALSVAETNELLAALATRTGGESGARLAQVPGGRIQSFHALTGGNPRTAGLLFEVLIADPGANAETALNALLDRVTPVYKDRFEALPDQLQRILDAVALAWNPTTAAAVAERVELPVNHASASLARLMQLGIVEQVTLPKKKRAGFQVAERFFNVWYLMRASRRLRRRLGHLVRFMEALWATDERTALVKLLLAGSGNLETSLAVAQTAGIREAAEGQALVVKRLKEIAGTAESFLAYVSEYAEPGPEGGMVRDAISREVLIRESREAVFAAKVDWAAIGTTPEECWEAVSASFSSWSVKHRICAALSVEFAERPAETAELLATLKQGLEPLAQLVGQSPVERLRHAFRDGWVDRTKDHRGANIAAAAGNPWPSIFAHQLDRTPNQIPAAHMMLAWAETMRIRDPLTAKFIAGLFGQRGEVANLHAAFVAVAEFNGASPLIEVVVNWLLVPAPAEALRVFRSWTPAPDSVESYVQAGIALLAADQAEGVIAAIEAKELQETMTPLFQAARVLLGGDPSILGELAPEVRLPTQAVLEAVQRGRDHLRELSQNPPTPPPPAKPPKPRKRA